MLHEGAHELVGRKCLGHNGHLAYSLLPFVGVAEKLRRVYVTYNVVDIFLEYNNFRVSRLDEHRLELLERGVYLDSFNFGAGNVALAHFYVRKVEYILEYSHVVVNLLLLGGVLNRVLYEVVELSF